MHNSTSYNWSQNADVQELSRLFMAIANTFDYGRKLAFEYRFDKLGMDARLKELEDIRANHYGRGAERDSANSAQDRRRSRHDAHQPPELPRTCFAPSPGTGQANATPAQP